jgi:hypothetical protein
MSKKRKKIEESEEEISYVTLKDGTKVVEPVYIAVVTILKSIASGNDGLSGGMALYDLHQKAFNPEYEIYSAKSKELLKGFIEEDGRLNDSVTNIVKNTISYKSASFSFNDGLKEEELTDQSSSTSIVESSKKSKLEGKSKSKEDDSDNETVVLEELEKEEEEQNDENEKTPLYYVSQEGDNDEALIQDFLTLEQDLEETTEQSNVNIIGNKDSNLES